MSASISRTFMPTLAKCRATVSAVVDLPSPGPALETSNVFGRPLSVDSCSAVHSDR